MNTGVNTIRSSGINSIDSSADAYIKADYSSISRNIKLSAENFDKDELKKLIIEILLEDPDSEVKKIAEDYLIQVLYHATDDPETNPIISRLLNESKNEIAELRTELINVKAELSNLKYNLEFGTNIDGSSYCSYSGPTNGVMWKFQYQGVIDSLMTRIYDLEAKLRNIGIGEDNMAN